MSSIARIWFGKLPASRGEEYVKYVEETGVRELRATNGNRGVLVLTRVEGEVMEISVISFWDSRESIERFAGENISKARYYPKDANFLFSLEPELQHYDIACALPLGGLPL
jgi:hypothetical protein